MKRDLLEALLAARREKRAVVLATDVGTGEAAMLTPHDADPPPGFGPEVLDAAREALRSDRSRLVDTARGRCFVHAFNPPLRLFVVGAVHIAQSLAPMALLSGYDVAVVDPRRAFASDARFSAIRILDGWPDEALAGAGLDARAAVVTLTHDPKFDDAALAVALRSDAFYVGCLGSRRTHAKRLERLRAAGFDEAEIGRIHAPIGVDVGAISPAEIAVSIMAEVTGVLRERLA